MLQGSAIPPNGADDLVPKVNVFGVDAAFWQDDAVDAKLWNSREAAVVINQTLATALGVEAGATVSLQVQGRENVPRETLLGKRGRDDVLQTLEVMVRRVVPDEGLARFTLRPSPEPVRNAFVPLAFWVGR